MGRKESERDIEGRRTAVARLMLSGKRSVREIADLIKKQMPGIPVSPATVTRDMAEIRAEWAESRKLDIDVAIAEDLARIDALFGRMMLKGINGDTNAVKTVLAMIQLRAELLGYRSLVIEHRGMDKAWLEQAKAAKTRQEVEAILSSATDDDLLKLVYSS